MSYRETYDDLCVLLEEYSDYEVEAVADQIMGLFGLVGENVLEALDPPAGLQHWLTSHGLSLVPTVEQQAPKIWELTQAEESTGEQEDVDLEGEDQGVTESVPLQVGDYVEYRTAPIGPRGQSQVGSGHIVSIDLALGNRTFIVATGPGRETWVDGATDFIQVARPAP